ncbi:dendritic arbor reduction protein 1 isoform X2 [Aedes aegypti]|uniref:Cytohesin Ubiquitin Protein Inducing domain-containing protein n=1 Tax=Aedes aegypti TaxID=7159 RepID=A0A6I8TMQ3_AEDAE|nr:dendritic arbor reduction protein 1 isoform X2 [Aedes aegypti]
MGDAKVKQPYYGTPPHHQQPTTSKAAVVGGPTVTDIQKGSPSSLKSASGGTNKEDNAAKSPSKYDQLKARKAELEKRLNEKYAQLQQIKREEAQLIGMYPSDFSAGIGSQDQNGTAPTLRRKIGTSFKLPENLLNNKEDDINKLLLEKQIQQQISEASLRLANDSGQSKSVRRTHNQNYETAQQKLLAINQNLSVLKKRQQQAAEQQKPPPATRDDIDIHKSSNFNRFRSNSNSSSMMMMNVSERRNSIKSNTSSNHSSNLNSSIGSASKQQQQLLVQIPGQQHPNHYHSQQISPYSIHSGTLSVMPSGSQSMTPAASAAMVSQLSMLRHRVRHDSFSGMISYDLSGASGDTAKLSPVSSGSGHHHHPHPHQHFQQQPHQQHQSGPHRLNKLIQQQLHSYSPPPGHHPHGTSPGFALSPPASGGSSSASGQAFVYDAKMISRLQPPPPPPPPASTSLSDQYFCPNVQPGFSYDQQQEGASAGLGGYWMLLETGEKVWCAVDNRFASLDRKQGGGSMKLSRSKQQRHPSEDSIQPDTISVTSGSSEHKKREKVWRETSLDSPVVKHKALPSISVNPPALPAYPEPPPPPPPHHSSYSSHSNSVQTPLHINTSSNYGLSSPSSPLLLSPQQMMYYQQKQQQILEHQRQQQQLRIRQLEEQKHQAYLLEQQQHQQLLQQKQLRSPPQLPKHHHSQFPPNAYAANQQQQQRQQQHVDLLPHSPQYYDRENHNLPPHYYQSQEAPPPQNNLSSRHPDLLISPTLSTSSSNTLTSPTLRPQSSVSPTPSTITTTSAGPGSGSASGIHSTPDIQTESPKNVTVVQQGKIQPYKEVTKPFEMSDFYKYSTKYRQKQQQQQQQHMQQQHHPQGTGGDDLSPNGNSSGAGDVIQKVVYQPPNPSICHPINYN